MRRAPGLAGAAAALGLFLLAACGGVTIDTDPPGGVVYYDGRVVGEAPVSLPLEREPKLVWVGKPGYRWMNFAAWREDNLSVSVLYKTGPAAGGTRTVRSAEIVVEPEREPPAVATRGEPGKKQEPPK